MADAASASASGPRSVQASLREGHPGHSAGGSGRLHAPRDRDWRGARAPESGYAYPLSGAGGPGGEATCLLGRCPRIWGSVAAPTTRLGHIQRMPQSGHSDFWIPLQIRRTRLAELLRSRSHSGRGRLVLMPGTHEVLKRLSFDLSLLDRLGPSEQRRSVIEARASVLSGKLDQCRSGVQGIAKLLFSIVSRLASVLSTDAAKQLACDLDLQPVHRPLLFIRGSPSRPRLR